MKRKWIQAAGLVCVALLFTGCAMLGTPLPPTDFAPASVDTENLVQKVDGFAVVLDASDSMIDPCQGWTKFNRARETVRRFNLTLPEIPVQGALRRFGHTRCPFLQRTAKVYGTTAYTTDGFAQGLGRIAFAGGRSPLAMAMDAAGADLNGVNGQLALIVVSDGEEIDDGPIRSAQALKQTYGDRLCIYTVQVGSDAGGKRLLEAVADAGECGAAVNAADISDPSAMAGFVRQVFFKAEKARLDTDGDGVYDELDLCPGTPANTTVDADGCPLDRDKDGVADARDRCPGTPMGVRVDDEGCPLDADRDGVPDAEDLCPQTPLGHKVDAQGCSLDSDYDGVLDHEDACPGTPLGALVDAKGCWTLEGLNFATDSARIRPAAHGVLEHALYVLQRNPDLRVEIQGHTDSRASARYNQRLSEARADAVQRYLVANGISAERLTVKGYGEERPTADNDTAEGRAQNRRVELKPLN